MNRLELEDVQLVAELCYNWEKLTNKTILISGGTGFLGTFLCDVLRYRNSKYKQNIKVICLSRNSHLNNDTVTYIENDITKPISINEQIDFIIHLASNTHPEQYKADPIGTIITNVYGTYNLLSLAKDKHVEKFLMASSCEIYGNCEDYPLKESCTGKIDCNTARAGYNESKRLCESLCQSFLQQYNVKSSIFRMARVFGVDRTKNDSKAMAQLINKAVRGEDIILKSKGDQKFSYIYIADAVSGIIKVLLDGEICEAYNIAADYDGKTLKEYADFLASLTGTRVVYDIKHDPNVSQAQNAVLDTNKIKKIGFTPLFSVIEGLVRTISILKD